MTLSYNWLSSYLPVQVTPERLSAILTSIGLEVESMEPYERVKGGLRGLLIGEVLDVQPHPNADKLRLTRVATGDAQPLSIVCGAPNVAAGQKVVVAPIGVTIYPTAAEPMTMKLAKIRGEESQGMICAEDEIGLGASHAGILLLPADAPVGIAAAEYFGSYTDTVYEIGLTPNRSDAMSHLGVARDLCAYLSHYDGAAYRAVYPAVAELAAGNALPVGVEVRATAACPRFTGVAIDGITVASSPQWLQDRLQSIGLRPINNVVDITNFIQHEWGQPLHAYDYDAIPGGDVIVDFLPEGTPFTTLDGTERKLSAADLMVCNREGGMCIAGVFGGAESGVTEGTNRIFLEAAYFDPATIRKTSFRHSLRTDAATRFEKGIDPSATLTVLQRATALILEVCGGSIASSIVDHHPKSKAPVQVTLRWDYLQKLTGKSYTSVAVKGILQSLGFDLLREDDRELLLQVPAHKHDVTLPADVVEEILRIDGLDNVAIPTRFPITPSAAPEAPAEALREKISERLAGVGFAEMLTNSISNGKYFAGAEGLVKMLNSLSTELDALRPAMLPTALQVIAHNHHRKSTDLSLFEWGKTYHSTATGYREKAHLCLYLTGNRAPQHWGAKAAPANLFYLKGVVEMLFTSLGLKPEFEASNGTLTVMHKPRLNGSVGQGSPLGTLRAATTAELQPFDIRLPVYFADLNADAVLHAALQVKPAYRELSRYPQVHRDLALVLDSATPYAAVEESIEKLGLKALQSARLFDLFESEKLGAGKKSLAVSFTFADPEKTLTDKEIDGWMQKLQRTLETELGAEIRR